MGVSFTNGSRVGVLPNGDRTFTAMLDSIAEAERCIDLITYVYRIGIAQRFAKALAARAEDGLPVRVLLD